MRLYIYIYIYVYIHTYIYMYINIEDSIIGIKELLDKLV